MTNVIKRSKNWKIELVRYSNLFQNVSDFDLKNCQFLVNLSRGVASSQSQGGPKAKFCPTFQKIHFLLHFYVTSQGGPRPWPHGPPSYDAPGAMVE